MLVDALQSPGDRLSSLHHSLPALAVHCNFAAVGQGDHDNACAKVAEFFDDILTFLPHHLTNVTLRLLGLLDQVCGVNSPSEIPH